MNDRVTVYDEQGNKLVLGPNDHLATGGEGAVYARKNTVFKVYLDPLKARKARLQDKVEVLKRLQHPGIAAPRGALLDKNGAFVGMSFDRVTGDALCKLFTSSWRDAHQFGDGEAEQVTLRMRDIMAHAHANNALLVDANELNWLVEGTKPTVIDVDSWQLPGFAATAIMPSIRDPLAAQGFTPGSDWFAWAIVTFQLWTGIHPYKGTHPDFARNALEARMKAGVSVFDAKVTVPAAARPVNQIPTALRQWYFDVFQAGARVAPPSSLTGGLATQIAPRVRMIQGLSTLNASLKQERLGNAGGRILAAFQGFAIAKTPTGLQLWDAVRKTVASWVAAHECEALLQRTAAVLRLPQTDVLVALTPGQRATLKTRDEKMTSEVPTRATKLWQSGSRLFAVVEGVANGLVELNASQLGARTLLTIGHQWPVNTLSTEFYRGCFIQDCLGTPFVGVLEGEGLVQLRAPALKGYRVVQALGLDAQNVWLTALRRADGESVRLLLTAQNDVFEVSQEELVQEMDLDGAALATGVGVVRLGDELRVSKGSARKALSSCGLSEGARLFSMGTGLGLFEDSEASRLSLV